MMLAPTAQDVFHRLDEMEKKITLLTTTNHRGTTTTTATPQTVPPHQVTEMYKHEDDVNRPSASEPASKTEADQAAASAPANPTVVQHEASRSQPV